MIQVGVGGFVPMSAICREVAKLREDRGHAHGRSDGGNDGVGETGLHCGIKGCGEWIHKG